MSAQEHISKKKKWRRIRFLLVLTGISAFFISPFPLYILSLAPHSLIDWAVAPVFQNITLDDHPEQMNAPKKYAKPTPLPVLGRNTGLCFTFQSLDERRLERAKHGKIIAEIIAVGIDKREYILDDVTLTEKHTANTKDKKSSVSIICQQFSSHHSLLPQAINALYIRPLKPFTPSKISWASAKDL